MLGGIMTGHHFCAHLGQAGHRCYAKYLLVIATPNHLCLRLRERDLRRVEADDLHETLDIDELSLSTVLIPDHELRDAPPELPRRDLLSRSLEVFSSVCLLCSASAASEPAPNRCEISSEPVGSAPFLASLAFGSSPRRPAAPPGRKVAT